MLLEQISGHELTASHKVHFISNLHLSNFSFKSIWLLNFFLWDCDHMATEGYVSGDIACGLSWPTELQFISYISYEVLCTPVNAHGCWLFSHPLQVNWASFGALLYGENNSHFAHVDIGQVFRSLSSSSWVEPVTYIGLHLFTRGQNAPRGR